MADVTTQRARRSPGCGASRPVVEGWEVAEVTRLWLAEAPAADLQRFHTSSDRTMKEPEHDRDDQESVKEQWGQNHNEAEAEADVCSDRMKWRRIKGDLCVGIVKRGTGKRQRGRKACCYLQASQGSPRLRTFFLDGDHLQWKKTRKCLSNFSAVWLGSNVLQSKRGNFTWKSSRRRSRTFRGGLKSRSESWRKRVRGFGRSIWILYFCRRRETEQKYWSNTFTQVKVIEYSLWHVLNV